MIKTYYPRQRDQAMPEAPFIHIRLLRLWITLSVSRCYPKSFQNIQSYPQNAKGAVDSFTTNALGELLGV